VGLIWAVRDAIEKREPIRENKIITGYQSVIVDDGVDDKRFLVLESELASVLGAITRQGSTLSPVVRNAWDRGDLESITKNSPAKATGAHVSIVGHVTRDELRATMTATEKANGFGNRFIWICSKRSKCLPEGGHLSELDVAPIIERLKGVLVASKRVGLIERDAEARAAWNRVYEDLSEGEPGLFGAATNRAEAQVLRLSTLYAVLDGSAVVTTTHLRAALAVWKYSESSARYIFGDAIGDETADTIDRALRAAKDDGLTRTEISRLFGRNLDAARIQSAINLLVEYRRVRSDREATEGRTAERWFSTVTR
jgi:hypothetical protein